MRTKHNPSPRPPSSLWICNVPIIMTIRTLSKEWQKKGWLTYDLGHHFEIPKHWWDWHLTWTVTLTTATSSAEHYPYILAWSHSPQTNPLVLFCYPLSFFLSLHSVWFLYMLIIVNIVTKESFVLSHSSSSMSKEKTQWAHHCVCFSQNQSHKLFSIVITE